MMATVEDYWTGRIVRLIRLAHLALHMEGIPILGSVVGKKIEQRMEPLDIHPATMDDARSIIEQSRYCAAGSRVCLPLFPGSVVTESVFIDELAEQMAAVKKARPVTKDQAVATLLQYPHNPLVISKVSGRYLEICRSEPETCIYWKIRKTGLNR